MRRIVRSGAREWSIGDTDAWGAPVDLRDRARASDFFGRLLREPDNATILRAVLRDAAAGTGTVGGAAAPRTNAEAADQLAAHAAAGRIRVIELAAPTPEMDTGGHIVAQEKKAPPASNKSVKLKVWVKFKVVDAASGRGVPNVRLRVTTPDGTEEFHTTSAEGLIEVRDIPAGPCAARCDLKDAKLADTLDFVGMGEAAPEEPGGGAAAGSSNGTANGAAGSGGAGGGGGGVKRIAEVEVHKVRTGESILKLAQGAGMRWQDLAKFNWGTDDPNEIHVCLRDIVGCTKRCADGYNYMFHDSDDPGIVLIPRPWEQSGLMTERTHIFRVQPLAVQRIRILQYEDSGYILPDADYTIVDEDGRIISVGRSDARARVRLPDNFQESWPILLGKPRRIVGRVLTGGRGGGDRQPLSKQTVSVHPWTCRPSEVKTDAEGRISLKDVPEGPVSVRYKDQEAVVFISADEHDAEFLLKPPPGPAGSHEDRDDHDGYPPAAAAAPGAITIRVVDPSGEPLPGAAVKVKQNGAEIFSGTADADGVVVVQNAKPDAPCDVVVDQRGTMPSDGCVECAHEGDGELPEYTYGEAPHDDAACSCGCEYGVVNDAGGVDEEAVA